VWASAVERVAASESAPGPTPPRPQAGGLTVRDTLPLVALVNEQLSVSGWEFLVAMAQPAGPFGAVVFGSIEGEAVRLEFAVDPVTDACMVHLFDMTAKNILAERAAASTFESAIEGYPSPHFGGLKPGVARSDPAGESCANDPFVRAGQREFTSHVF
jgi:hypothetical protein